MSFSVEYKRGSTGPAMFQRQVRFQVDISAISKQPSEPLFAITFTLLSGKFYRNSPIVSSLTILTQLNNLKKSSILRNGKNLIYFVFIRRNPVFILSKNYFPIKMNYFHFSLLI